MRAATLLNTITMQNVAWATASVAADSSMPSRANPELRAMPVTMPGRAIGSTMMRFRELRPKNS